MADDPTLVDDDAVVDDGTAAQEAAQEEEERQAAAAAGMEPGGSTSQNMAESTPQDGAVMDSGGGGEGGGGGGGGETESGMSPEMAEQYEQNFGAGEGDDSANVYTPGELQDSLQTGEEQIEEIGGSTSGGEPGLGDLGGYGDSGMSEPSVAIGDRYSEGVPQSDTAPPSDVASIDDGPNGSIIYRDKDDNVVQIDFGDPADGPGGADGPGSLEGEEAQQWYNQYYGTTTGQQQQEEGAGEEKQESGLPLAETYKQVEEELNALEGGDPADAGKDKKSTIEQAKEAAAELERQKQEEARKAEEAKKAEEEAAAAEAAAEEEAAAEGEEELESSPDPTGGGEPVPGSQAEQHLEELQEQMPEDTGPGNVDPNEYDDGEGDGDPTWGVAPGVSDPPDEQDSSGGGLGTPQDQSGWDTDPVDDDDVGMTLGPDDGSMELPSQQPTLDASDVVPGGGDGEDGDGRPTVEAEEQYVVVADSGMPQRTDVSDDGFGSGAIEAVANTDVFNRPAGAGVKGTAASTEPPGVEADDVGPGHYGQAMAVEVTAHVAVPAEPDAPSRATETDLEDAEIEIIANALADDASAGRGEDDLDPFD